MSTTPLKLVLVIVGGLALLPCAGAPAGAADEAAPAVAGTAPARAATTPVGTVVAERPATARLFELLGIDYCCGGARTLGEAAAARDLDVDRLLDVLALLEGRVEDGGGRDWTRAPLGELIDHIVATHHAFLRRELPRLSSLVGTVARVHGAQHPEWVEVKALTEGLRVALLAHLEDEERTVFPAIRAPQAVPAAQQREMLERLAADHDEAGATLLRLRVLTAGHAVPADACALTTQLLQGLQALERDLHMHVHLENNVLLPRARAALSAR